MSAAIELAIAIAAAVLAVVELARSRGSALLAWAVLGLAAIVILGRVT